ncbi:MAG: ABC transporter ATP-binding protein [Oscillospiraceae bacterium]|nr:ABC transporter ATP-binding protein [Oscillospiraceae bacterium]
MTRKSFQPDRILSYFRMEWFSLLLVTVSGLIYNLGLLAGPWFEGKMTGCLVGILGGTGTFSNMLTLVIGYVIAIGVVQGARYLKRFYVRRFANNVNRSMKGILYGNLVEKSRKELEEEGAGSIMTKAILDVDDCAEGMRKFTTEIFDTGVALAAYAGMLLYYDWRLAILCMLLPPISYTVAEKMKCIIQRTGAAYKIQSGILSSATLDCASNAITYRVFGCETQRKEAYEENLDAYEKSAVRANIWNAALPPIYKVISMAGCLFILYFGGRNVLGSGWKAWDVAAFTTFLSCFTKLSTKSSSAAKLFNAVHKAQVSWKRIRPLMKETAVSEASDAQQPDALMVSQLSFSYPNGKAVFDHLSFSAQPGEIIGITGPVACGKSTLGKVFLCEYPYQGSIQFHGQELGDMARTERTGIVGYLGHDPELFNDTVSNNILMGDSQYDVQRQLKMVCLDEEVRNMEDGTDTLVGSSGIRLSGGQAQRLSLARTLCHMRPVLVLDDPFSALDRSTEEQIFTNLKAETSRSIVLLISHRLYLFPKMDRIIWMGSDTPIVGTHRELMDTVPEYATLFHAQEGGHAHEAR